MDAPTNELLPGEGVSLACQSWAGKGRTVLACHGLTANSSFWAGVADRLGGRRPLLAPDLRGRGLSDQAAPGHSSGIDLHASDLAAILRSRGPGKSLVVGHSLGAYIVASLAANYPELVAGVVFVDGGYTAELGFVTVDSLIDYLLKPILTRLERTYESVPAQHDAWRNDGHFRRSEWSPWIEAYLARGIHGAAPVLRERASPEAAREDFMELTRREAINARLERIKCPTLLLRATAGFLPTNPAGIPAGAVVQFRRYLPELEDELVTGTTHYTICLADPGATATANAIVRWAEKVGV